MNEPRDRERAIFEAASRLPPKERAAYLDDACGLDGELRERVVQALYDASANHTSAPGQPKVSGAAETIVVPRPPGEPGEKPGDLIGPYKLLEKLGEGGMGSVWVAEQREPVRRKVALKVIKLGMDTKQVIARFEAERQALALMDHPNIAKVLDAGATEKGRPYFVMELVNGIRITEYCDLHNVPTRQRLEIFVQVCRAVAHAHLKGIIHRDIKPPNILITVHDGSPSVRIIDFGIAKAVAGQRLTEKTVYTALEEFIGTPAYMSPEQAEMNPLGIDARTDIYALGVLLYELLTGLTPFAAERLQRLGPDEIRRIIREEEPPRPSTKLTTLKAEAQTAVARHRQCDAPKLRHLVQGDLDWIVMRCLDKDRTRRFQSADDLVADVQRYLDGKPIVTRPRSPLYWLVKLMQRHKAAFGVAALTLAGTCAALALVALVWPGLLARRPPSPEQRLARADELLKHYDEEGAIPKAIFELKEALNTDRGNARLWAKLGWAKWLLASEDEREETRLEAFQCSSNALSINDKVYEAHLVQGLASGFVRDWPPATNQLLAAKEQTRSANPVVLISLAAVLQAAGDAPQANSFAQLAEQEAGDNWDAFDRLGNFYYRSGQGSARLERPRECFVRAIQLAPRSPLAHRDLGKILLLERKLDLALEQFKRSLALRQTPQALSGMGSVYLAQTNPARAADYFCAASQLDPSKYLYHFRAALALNELTNRLSEATNHFKQASLQAEDSLSPNAGGEKPLVRAHQGICEAVLGHSAKARSDLEQSLKEAGADMSVLRMVHLGFEFLGDTNRMREVENLMRRKPNK